VLVVDDEPINLALVRAVLGGEHIVFEAPNARTALEILDREEIDLVLLDVRLPDMDGFTACREIKARHSEAGYLPVLLLTALADQESRNAGLEAGADDFLSKPFDRKELVLRARVFLRLRAQDEHIRKQLDEMRRLDQLKDDLTSLLIHDMRNPLAGIDGMLWVLRQDATGEAAAALDDAALASRHLRDAVEDLLKIRLIEQGELHLAREPITLKQIADQAVSTLEGEAMARGLGIEIECDDGDQLITADAPLLRRAVENLIANALRYTRPRSVVTLTVHGEKDIVEIAVADRGPGVPDAFKSEVFAKYRTMDSGGARQRRGSGLGLYLVKLATEAHGGVASVEDRDAGGAIFRIRIPRDAAAAS
jgi:two-component system, sensor histidine kinase and response regulator